MPDYTQGLNTSQGLKTAADYSFAQQRWVNSVGSLGDAGAILTTTPLGGSASYSQTGVDRLAPTGTDKPAFPVGRVCGIVWADQAGTLYLEESDDNSNWPTTASVAVSANTTTTLPWTSVSKRWFRFRYVNGATAQGSFILVQQAGGLGLNDIQVSGSIIPEETRNIVRVGTLAAATEETQLDVVGKDIEIQFLELAADDANNIALKIKAYKSDGTLETSPMWTLLLTGTSGDYVTPVAINTNKSSTFDYLGINKIGLKRAMRFANGVKVTVQNFSGTLSYNAGFTMNYVQIKKS